MARVDNHSIHFNFDMVLWILVSVMQYRCACHMSILLSLRGWYPNGLSHNAIRGTRQGYPFFPCPRPLDIVRIIDAYKRYSTEHNAAMVSVWR